VAAAAEASPSNATGIEDGIATASGASVEEREAAAEGKEDRCRSEDEGGGADGVLGLSRLPKDGAVGEAKSAMSGVG